MDKNAKLKEVIRGLSALNMECMDDRKKALILLYDGYRIEHESIFNEVSVEIEAEKLKREQEKAKTAKETQQKAEANWLGFTEAVMVNGSKINESKQYKGKKYAPATILRPLLISSMVNLPDVRTNKIEFEQAVYSEWNNRIISAMVFGAMLDFTFVYKPH